MDPMFKAIFNNAFGSIVRARQGGLRPRPSRARRARPAPTMTEQLEGRRLLSFTFVGGVVTATGTSGADVITVYENIISNHHYIVVKIAPVGGTSETSTNYDVDSVTRVDVYGGAGDDTLVLESDTAGHRTPGAAEVSEGP